MGSWFCCKGSGLLGSRSMVMRSGFTQFAYVHMVFVRASEVGTELVESTSLGFQTSC